MYQQEYIFKSKSYNQVSYIYFQRDNKSLNKLEPISVNVICQERATEGIVELTTFHRNFKYQEFSSIILTCLLEYHQKKGYYEFLYTTSNQTEDEPVNQYFKKLANKKIFSEGQGPNEACIIYKLSE